MRVEDMADEDRIAEAFPKDEMDGMTAQIRRSAASVAGIGEILTIFNVGGRGSDLRARFSRAARRFPASHLQSPAASRSGFGLNS